MNKKKLIIGLFLLVFIVLLVYYILTNISISKVSEDEYLNYTPQEEISDIQSRQTSIVLYFLDKQTNELKSHSKIINSNELLENPYKVIVQSLLEKPSNSNLESVFPENTRLLDAKLDKNCVVLNFSEDLLNFKNDEEKYNIINCILNSLSQLTEVNSIKFLINNKQVESIAEEYSVIS